MATPPPPEQKGPWKAPRALNSSSSSKKALLPDKQQDWEYARAQYEAGIKSVRVIGDEIGVTPMAVYARISNEGWVKNIDVLTQKRIEYKLAIEEAKNTELIVQRDKAERVNVEMQARILVRHRSDIGRVRTITMRLFQEIESMMDFMPEFKSLGEIMRNPDERGRDKLANAYEQALSLAGRTDIVKKLSDSLKTQLQLERQAFGIQGALEDPESPQTAQAGKGEIDVILDKFDLVLKKKDPAAASPTGTTTVLGEIVDATPRDVSPTN